MSNWRPTSVNMNSTAGVDPSDRGLAMLGIPLVAAAQEKPVIASGMLRIHAFKSGGYFVRFEHVALKPDARLGYRAQFQGACHLRRISYHLKADAARIKEKPQHLRARSCILQFFHSDNAAAYVVVVVTRSIDIRARLHGPLEEKRANRFFIRSADSTLADGLSVNIVCEPG